VFAGRGSLAGDFCVQANVMATETISAALVKQLRDQTGVGMMECKAALAEANGNLEEATTLLRKRGLAQAAKKAGRSIRDLRARMSN
jgi:ribosomal protein L7/L12